MNYYTSLFNEIYAISNTHAYSILKVDNIVFLAYLR